MSDEVLESEFAQVMGAIKQAAHGSPCLPQIRGFLEARLNKEKRKIRDRALFLGSRLLCDPIRFQEAGMRVWGDDLEKNSFPFLQGDVITTLTVSIIGKSFFANPHNHWFVLTPSCDVVRKNFIRVAPVYLIEDFFVEGTPEQRNLYNAFAIGLKVGNHRFFSLPIFPHGGSTILGGVVDLSFDPSFLAREHTALATPITSLTLDGWNIFNALVQEHETRANLEEEEKLRDKNYAHRSWIAPV
jgi:hypothetical protein